MCFAGIKDLLKRLLNMKMFIALVLSSTILTCSALHDLRSIDEDNTNEESYHSEYIDQPERFDQSESFDQPESLDQSEFGVFNNPEHDESEIVAIRVHVKYQDAARAALLQLAADRRKKEEGITNSFLKVIDEYEKEIAEFQAGFGRRRVVHDQINRTEQFIREAVKNRRFNAEVLRALTALGIFFSEKIEVKRGLRKRSADNLARGARAFLGQIKDNIGDDAFNKYMGINGLITLMFVMDTTGSMSGDIEAAIVISAQIVNQTKENNVDYILSPFNDPCKLFHFFFCNRPFRKDVFLGYSASISCFKLLWPFTLLLVIRDYENYADENTT